MAWWTNLFHTDAPMPLHDFGRGINANINPDERQFFDDSAEFFQNKENIKAYDSFLNSLINFKAENSNENITIEIKEDALHFKIYQGIAVIHGIVTEQNIEAYADIAKVDNNNVAFQRRILERNFQLTYSRFYITDNKVKLKIYLDNTTMTPQKIFYPLREIALNADYEKEFITSEFKSVQLLDTAHVIHSSDEIIKIKYDAMMSWIEKTKDALTRLPSNDNASILAFTYLTLLFKIDYLVVPRDEFSQKLIEKINDYFGEEDKLVGQRNDDLRIYIDKMQTMDLTFFSKNIYNSKNSFSPMEKTTHDDVSQFIEESLAKIRWHKTNRFTQIIPTIYEYIAFYMLYNYGMHPSLQSLVHLLVEISHQDFFSALGYQKLYEEETFDKKAISRRIENAIEPYQAVHPELVAFGDELNYSSMEEFHQSFYLQIKHLDYTEL